VKLMQQLGASLHAEPAQRSVRQPAASLGSCAIHAPVTEPVPAVVLSTPAQNKRAGRPRLARRKRCSGRPGLRVLEPEEYGGDPAAGAAAAERELKQMLEGLAQHLFGSGTEVRRACTMRHAQPGGSAASSVGGPPAEELSEMPGGCNARAALR